MLHRAASNAYSWWWASHIRTKQSKWLDQNLQDMEEKVQYVLKLIEEDGDSFAKRAEMYYKKRPELISFVEESYRAYRALAERYDHISTELQNANHTIASVFPEQVPFPIDEEDEDNSPRAQKKISELSKVNIPKVPHFPSKDLKSVLTKTPSKLQSKKTWKASVSKSNLSKTEAVDAIDKLQKGILSLQTQKEFVKSSYESGLAKYWELEKQIKEMQQQISSLQDEFGIAIVIEDDDARNLIASAALKSCQDKLEQLQEKQDKSAEEGRKEFERIKGVRQKLNSLKDELFHDQTDQKKSPEEEKFVVQKGKDELESFRVKIKEQLQSGSDITFTVTDMAEKIDELVNKVIRLETAVSSQDALIMRLKSETDELQAQIRSLEDDRAAIIDGRNDLNKIMEIEEKLHDIEGFNLNVEGQNKNLKMHFTEARCNLDHLSEQLQNVRQDESSEKHEEAVLEVEYQNELNDQEKEMTEKDKSISVIAKEISESGANNDHDDLSEKWQELNVQEVDKQDLSENVDKDEPNWKQLFMNGLEDREKILLTEYTTILRNYKDVKKKLNEVEKDNKDSLFEVKTQLRELKSANVLKDEEIQLLRQKLNLLQIVSDGNEDLKELLEDQTIEPVNTDKTKAPPVAEEEEETEDIKMISIDQPQLTSAVEEKFRMNIDELLEENLNFWLRFSTSYHDLQKFQTQTQDLQSEISKLKEKRKKNQEGSSTTREPSLKSEARPIYKHLREIQTELTVWLERSVLLKDELKCRFSSLCNIQEDITRALKASAEDEEFRFTSYQAAKYQGEILNMKQENNKVADELQAGLDHVVGLQLEVERSLAKLNEEFGISGSKNHHFWMSHSISRTRVPLRSFIFGVKPKKQKPSIFSCVNPAMHRKFNALKIGPM